MPSSFLTLSLPRTQPSSIVKALSFIELGIKAIVTAVRGGEVKHAKEDVTDHLYIPAYDVPSQNISQYFEETYQFIDNVRKKTNVLVHCHAGISRSATIVIAYLLRKYNYSLDNVIAMVKRRRSKVIYLCEIDQPKSRFSATTQVRSNQDGHPMFTRYRFFHIKTFKTKKQSP